MVAVLSIISSLLSLYLLVLLIRIVLDLLNSFSRDWRPKGPVLVLANLVYALTDPPLQWLSRLIPVLRIGGIGFDMGFLVLFFGITVLQSLLGVLARSL